MLFWAYSADIKALTDDNDGDYSGSLLDTLRPVFRRYNEEQLVRVKLPGGSQEVSSIVAEFFWPISSLYLFFTLRLSTTSLLPSPSVISPQIGHQYCINFCIYR